LLLFFVFFVLSTTGKPVLTECDRCLQVHAQFSELLAALWRDGHVIVPRGRRLKSGARTDLKVIRPSQVALMSSFLSCFCF
jgi:hypothetical protein